MVGEPVDVVRHHEMQPAGRIHHLPDLKNFHVVAKHVAGHLEWCHVDYLNLWVFKCEDSA